MKYLTGILFLLVTTSVSFAQSTWITDNYWFNNNKKPCSDSLIIKNKGLAYIAVDAKFYNDTNYLQVYLVNNTTRYFKYALSENGYVYDLHINKVKNNLRIYPRFDFSFCGNGITKDSLPPGYCIVETLKFEGYKEYTFDEDTILSKVVFDDEYVNNLMSKEFTLYFPKRKYKTKDSISGRFIGHYSNEISAGELNNIIDSLVVYNIYTNKIDERYVFSQATIVLVPPGSMKSFRVNSNKLSDIVLKTIMDLPAGSKIMIDNIKVKGKQPFDDHYLYPVVYHIK